jgi:tRNA threonylcarbamoyladenosine biosynthesis protein TsaE
MRATPDSVLLDLPSLEATEALAARLAPLLHAGDTLLLHGSLGAGKTAFARALLRAMTGDPALDVPSPSFTLVQSYDTPAGPVHHYDLWRIEHAADLAELGLDEALQDITLIEWPERLGDAAPRDALSLTCTAAEDGRRLALFGGLTERFAGILRA